MNDEMSIPDELFEPCHDLDRALDDLENILKRIVDAEVKDIELAISSLYSLADDMPKLMRGEDE